MVRKNGSVRKTNKKLKKERTNNMKTPKLTQTRHFKKIAASAIAITMIGTILVMPTSNRTENELLGGTSFPQAQIPSRAEAAAKMLPGRWTPTAS